MNAGSLRVAGYRTAATVRRRRSAYLSLVLLVALVGGLAMAAVAGGRRTQASYPLLMQATRASTVTAITSILNPLIPGAAGRGYDPAVVRELRHLPHVTAVADEAGLDVLALTPTGSPVAV
ncbi:MAG TPA: hypothetical protein VMB72_13935, partial [Acidimicrobiales bacterium]|nr:hypothetical protein [Acidimicrobiales bacterium]